jgi:Mor family transcriptional regulator
MKHTPGPWSCSKLASPDYAPQYGVFAGDSMSALAIVVKEDSQANAVLIAAAPDLLKTLMDVAGDSICMKGFHEQFRRQIRDAIHYATTI